MTSLQKLLDTKTLLWLGVLAGPIYLTESIFQILTQEGFSITRHSWSVLSNGQLGWLHILNFLITGLFTILSAVGLQHVLRDKKGTMWGPKLMMVYGFFLIMAGLFKADPVDGYPIGTPLGAPTTVSTNGILHLVFGMFGFIGLISACVLFYKYFNKVKDRNFARFSLFTGVYFLLGFLSVMFGGFFGSSGQAVSILAFTLAVILSWSWYTKLSWKFLQQIK